ncbi:MAG TPA: hypothetical protein VGQ17_09955 [Gemmatimonadales bacterium]|jgi:hypothetical protein|nr:hypothetical protein [Gemmatimonadales bacterium]
MIHCPKRLPLFLGATLLLGACREPSRPSELASGTVARAKVSRCRVPVPDGEIPLPLAPASQRVDLYEPVFSSPTEVVNPLFPIRRLSQVILVGASDGKRLRVETTLLPGTQPIALADRVVETLTSQYIAYLDRRIAEVALDWYAQDSRGAVWYFGEDVFNYEAGRIEDTEGTWVACADGPAAMIMPAAPQVGDVYRPENAFPIVFEEVRVKSVGLTVPGPRGPVTGAIVARELHQDGSQEDKIFAPGYGEFSSGDGADIEAVALAVPIDALPGGMPAALTTVLRGARRAFEAARAGDWAGASTEFDAVSTAWATYRSGGVPPLLEPLMQEALDDLEKAITRRNSVLARQAALDVLLNGLDLSLRHRSRVAVDVDRLELWTLQLVLDAAAADGPGAASDLAILARLLERLTDAGSDLDSDDLRELRRAVEALSHPLKRADFAALERGARNLLSLLDD